jgi:hypothetical protein
MSHTPNCLNSTYAATRLIAINRKPSQKPV